MAQRSAAMTATATTTEKRVEVCFVRCDWNQRSIEIKEKPAYSLIYSLCGRVASAFDSLSHSLTIQIQGDTIVQRKSSVADSTTTIFALIYIKFSLELTKYQFDNFSVFFFYFPAS